MLTSTQRHHIDQLVKNTNLGRYSGFGPKKKFAAALNICRKALEEGGLRIGFGTLFHPEVWALIGDDALKKLDFDSDATVFLSNSIRSHDTLERIEFIASFYDHIVQMDALYVDEEDFLLSVMLEFAEHFTERWIDLPDGSDAQFQMQLVGYCKELYEQDYDIDTIAEMARTARIAYKLAAHEL